MILIDKLKLKLVVNFFDCNARYQVLQSFNFLCAFRKKMLVLKDTFFSVYWPAQIHVMLKQFIIPIIMQYLHKLN